MATVPQLDRQPLDVAHRVLRRAHVSKMTRTLQDRLALANVKIQHGWENMPLALIEPQVEEKLRRKRPGSSHDALSDTASSTSTRVRSSSGLESSPLTAPMFSDDALRFESSHGKKRIRPLELPRPSASGPIVGRRQRLNRQSSWKRANRLPESSPINPARHTRLASAATTTQLSFISECSTIPDSPPSPIHSEDDDADLPITSFSVNAPTRITSSPPRTPPPDRRLRKMHTSNVSWSRTPRTGDGDADLLLYLATSPLPAIETPSKTHLQPPSTPPCRATPLPSSHMTPGTSGAGFLGFGPHTPATNFNFADFVNVTPSPAQTHWARTPATSHRTPAAAREARRKLNFDSLLPTSTSPMITRTLHGEGLGMELGGELIS